MRNSKYNRFITFLKEELAISAKSIDLAEKVSAQEPLPKEIDLASFPMILWQYGLVNLEQLDQIFDWLETA